MIFGNWAGASAASTPAWAAFSAMTPNLNWQGKMLSGHPTRRLLFSRMPQTAVNGLPPGDPPGAALSASKRFQADEAEARCFLIWPGVVPVHRLNAWLNAQNYEYHSSH